MSKSREIAYICLFLFLALLPFLFSSYYVGLVIQILIMAIFAISLDILVGHTGLPSLGHAAYFGMSAYTVAFLYVSGFRSLWSLSLLGIGFSGLTACLFGLLSLRTKGAYFMLITLALSQVLWGIAFKWRSLTRGDDGIPGIGRPEITTFFSLKGDVPFYYFIVVVCLFLFFVLSVFLQSPFGYALRGIRESESRMRTIGYNTWLYKYLAFVFSAVFAGASGALWVFYSGFVNPSYFGLDLSAKALLMVILGGSGTLIGPLIGSAAIVLLENIVSSIAERWTLLLGLAYVLVIMFLPEGVHSLWRRVLEKGERG